ncbi:hypothetical protein CLOSPI_00857 [Thomasclavelia spiroformis DSM 1552]|uniref:Uncharacterized protein n=1 Tax=Thomasclavelia spiroformis DSM 1552 TaxID=428126 RepID=B1C0X6_9FIRM|nr:hypothetical protein CLOSPI_00857 [Thomasclavelia spiroformis DSM 1552]
MYIIYFYLSLNNYILKRISLQLLPLDFIQIFIIFQEKVIFLEKKIDFNQKQC